MTELVIQDWDVDKLSDEQKDLVKSICPQATKTELLMFFNYCKKLGLDPFRKQIYFVKYGNHPPAIIIGIDGFRSIAGKSGKLSGIERGTIKDDEGKLTGAWAKVHRHDWKVPATVEIDFQEYFSPAREGKKPNNWNTKPQTMIQKCAEAAALRMAFPEDLSGVYADGEFDKERARTVESTVQDVGELNKKLKEITNGK